MRASTVLGFFWAALANVSDAQPTNPAQCKEDIAEASAYISEAVVEITVYFFAQLLTTIY